MARLPRQNLSTGARVARQKLSADERLASLAETFSACDTSQYVIFHIKKQNTHVLKMKNKTVIFKNYKTQKLLSR